MAPALRVLLGTFGAMSIVASANAIHRTGIRIPDARGLLFRPAARFGDLVDPLQAVRTGLPYDPYTNIYGTLYPHGQNYPPGFIPLLRLLDIPSLRVAEALLVLVLAVTFALIARYVAFADFPAIRDEVAVITAVLTVIGVAKLDLYPVVALAAGTVALFMALRPPRDRTLSSSVLMIPIALGFPTIFAVDRMNIDIAVFALSVVAIVLVLRNRGTSGAALIGIAAAMKVYPACLLVIERPKRAWSWIWLLLTAGVAFAVWSILGVAFTHYGVSGAVGGFRTVLAWYDTEYAVGNAGMEYGASLLSGLKLVAYETGGDGKALATSLFPVWRVAWIPLCAIVAVATVVLRFPVWARVTIAVTTMLLASPVTGGYRCLFLLIPLALWIGDTLRGSRKTHWTHGVAAGFGLALAPLTLWGHYLDDARSLTSETLLLPGALLLLLISSSAAGWRNR